MGKIKILIKGYCREKDGKEQASSTVVLIRENGKKIIVDPGINRKKLVAAIQREKLSLSDIDFVFLTHYHADHILLAGIFENARILDSDDIYSFNGEIRPHAGKIPGTDIKIIKTPGHSCPQASLLVKTEDLGLVAIAADVFWWMDKEKQKTDENSLLKRPDPYQENRRNLLKSRVKILKKADYIIPGHGKMFKNPLRDLAN